jgi:hypothetical protein
LSHIEITPAAWRAEKQIAERSLSDTGHLPTGDELGGRFWDMVHTHFIEAVDTGHLARFEADHCRFVDEHEHMPIVPPVMTIHTSACVPIVPMPPATPSIPCSGSVPEPACVWMFGLGLAAVWLAHRVNRWIKNRPALKRAFYRIDLDAASNDPLP